MRILIISGRDDSHTFAVEFALKRMGHDVYILAPDDISLKDTLTFDILFDRNICTLDLNGKYINIESVDSVWNRRPFEKPSTYGVYKDDEPFVEEEILAALKGVYYLLGAAKWVNPFASLDRAENKIYQLSCATSVGFKRPDTLISNNPEDIRKFLRAVKDCIYKPLNGHIWYSQGKKLSTFTSIVKEEDLPIDRVLRAAPGIFQRRIKSVYEVRAQFFGKSYAAIKIDASKDGGVDWRFSQNAIERCDPIEIPHLIYARCLDLMERLGIISAAFDFMVDLDGSWVFLEVNQAGQFLFIEEWCPELPVLDMFCGLLTNPSPHYEYSARADPIRFVDAVDSYRPEKCP